MSSDYTRQIRDRESWLNSVLSEGADGERELTSLLGTAALARGAMQAIAVPEAAETASRERCVTILQEQWRYRSPPPPPRKPWLASVGSLLRVVFTLGRRR